MGKNKNASKPLTHEEIWDDSALVRSWDEAVEEYKLYHSIHARGENVDDVLREAEAAELAQVRDQNFNDGEDMDTGEAKLEEPIAGPVQTAATPDGAASNLQAEASQATQPNAQPPQQSQDGPHVAATSSTGATTLPQAAFAQVQDEGLKNLMMAWYYAGYYTGLYEGQQRANRNISS